ncbi:O133 family O-antigen polymerase [Escherichia coli]
MAYLFISLLFVLLFAEIKITQRKFSPTIVLITLWIGVLIVTQIYSSALWQLSVETMWWVFGGVFAFFIGGFWGKLFFKIYGFKNISLQSNGNTLLFAIPFYILMFFFYYFMVRAGANEDQNWYVGIRKIINYGEPDLFFIMFGYIYYLIYPMLYLEAARYYSSKSFNKKDKYNYHMQLIMCILYAVMSTAKLKLLLVIVPVFFIRSYFKPTSTKLIIVVGTMFLGVFFLSLILLNKIAGDIGVFKIIITSIGNYTFFNLYAFDSLHFKEFLKIKCIDNSNSCSLLPFFEYGDFRTNIYTIMYSFIEYGFFSYSLFLFMVGFIHNAADQIAKKTSNIYAIILSSVLYVPLVFQIMYNQYTASKYLIYILMFSYVVYFTNVRRLRVM